MMVGMRNSMRRPRPPRTMNNVPSSNDAPSAGDVPTSKTHVSSSQTSDDTLNKVPTPPQMSEDEVAVVLAASSVVDEGSSTNDSGWRVVGYGTCQTLRPSPRSKNGTKLRIPALHTSGSRSHLKKEDLDQEPAPLELCMTTHKRKAGSGFVDNHTHQIVERSKEIIPKRSSQSNSPLSFQDECDPYGGVGSRGAISSLTNRDEIRAPRRAPCWMVELQRKNAILRADMATIQETQAAHAIQIQAVATQLEATKEVLRNLQSNIQETRANLAPTKPPE